MQPSDEFRVDADGAGNDGHLFCVSVPVLSVQTTLELAVVSQEPRTRTSRSSSVIRLVAEASARVTASGRPVWNKREEPEMKIAYNKRGRGLCLPSGTATTTRVTEMMRIWTKAMPFSFADL